MKSILTGAMLALATTTATAQQLTPFQRQVLGAIKGQLVEYLQKQHATCNATSKMVCDMERVDVIDEVLERWENTPAYGTYALNMLKWHGDMAMAIGQMANTYVARHGALDPEFLNSVQQRMVTDQAFQPPREYTCRHLFGAPTDFCR
jgi:hypothetical protein